MDEPVTLPRPVEQPRAGADPQGAVGVKMQGADHGEIRQRGGQAVMAEGRMGAGSRTVVAALPLPGVDAIQSGVGTDPQASGLGIGDEAADGVAG